MDKKVSDLTLDDLERIKAVLVDPMMARVDVTLGLITDPVRGYVPRPEVDSIKKLAEGASSRTWYILAVVIIGIVITALSPHVGSHL